MDKVKREELRRKFVEEYTKEKIRNLTFEEYAVGYGKQNKSFCYRLETELRCLGSIQGNTSEKFGVYWDKKDEVMRHNKKFGDTPEQAFETTKAEIVKLIECVENDDDDGILASNFGPVVRGKILFLYFPEKYICIYSEVYLRYFLSVLNIGCDKKDNHLTMQKKLMEYKNNNRDTRKMDNFDFYDYIYSRYDPRKCLSNDDFDESRVNNINVNLILHIKVSLRQLTGSHIWKHIILSR